MTWKNVTVRQWQELCDLHTTEANDPDADLNTPMIAIMTGMTLTQIDSLSKGDRDALIRKFSFIKEVPKGEPQRYIDVNGRRYRCVYDIRQMKTARYIESKYFASDPNGNLHRIAASMVHPMRRGWFGWRDAKYDAARHEEYANDMLDAPVTAIFGSVLFFCEVYKWSIRNLVDYLIPQMMVMGMTRIQAEAVVISLSDVMDGITTLRLSPITSA